MARKKRTIEEHIELFDGVPPPIGGAAAERNRLVRAMRARNLKECICGVCRQQAIPYPRSITRSMAIALIILYHESRPDNGGEMKWVHWPGLLQRVMPSAKFSGGDHAKFLYWGLVEKMPGKRDDGSARNGYYRITEKGIRFVLGDICVEEYFVVYNKKDRGCARRMSSIKDSLANKFNYDKLMMLNPLEETSLEEFRIT